MRIITRIVIYFFISAALWAAMILGFNTGYRTGQVDALSGQKICYELSARPDNSIIWQKMNPCQEGEKK